jgi:tripartite-type tricarboxylate transporter receptor subunit TctC
MSSIARWRRIALAPTVAALAMAAFGAPRAQAQSGADYFKGKTINYIVATNPGGGYDTYGRLVAEYMQRHLPGATVVVRNMPGAGHMIGTNAIYAAKPDGLTVGTFNTGLIYNQLIHHRGVRFDLEKMSWIGKVANDARGVAVAQQSSIMSYQDLVTQKQPVNFAAAGIGSAAYVETVMLSSVLKWPVKVLTGYNGNDDQLAMRRGEIVGAISARSTWDPVVRNGYARYIAQIGGDRTDVPQLASLVQDAAGKALIALIQTQCDISRLTAGPPGIPADRLAALRGAFRMAMADKEFLAKTDKLGLPVQPAYGDAVLAMVKEALSQSPETIALLAQSLNKK